MSIDWDSFSKDVDQAIEESVAETNDSLASQLSSLTSLKDSDVKAMFPQTENLRSCVNLMEIVNSNKDDNEKINEIMNNTEAFAKVTLRLLEKLC
ncbi:hypothetical protein [Aeromonas salmonicida]|jgi:TRAP-type mannitol/chloroaromatic compound transport system substrate-binding protein|uniref:hypothetical protein n=1 Tax=Aeromonas salmonicida TaxID=645 RepID=UPI001788DEBC|nr:hypothetical protein [Aeromonas salmonicida]QOI95894.1 hypothetical protein G7042_23655 [Aeromonas salmonicida subsp. masoucida]